MLWKNSDDQLMLIPTNREGISVLIYTNSKLNTDISNLPPEDYYEKIQICLKVINISNNIF